MNRRHLLMGHGRHRPALGAGPTRCGAHQTAARHRPVHARWQHRHPGPRHRTTHRLARQAQGSGSARTFVTMDGDRVVGYFSLTVGKIDRLEASERIRKGMGHCPVPVVILARLAVSRPDQGRHIGVGLMQDAICRTLALAELARVRALLTHPIDDNAARFYHRFGFEASPAREQQMLLLLLKDARHLLSV